MKKWQQGLAAGLAAMVLVSSSAVGLADERDDKLKEFGSVIVVGRLHDIGSERARGRVAAHFDTAPP